LEFLLKGIEQSPSWNTKRDPLVLPIDYHPWMLEVDHSLELEVRKVGLLASASFPLFGCRSRYHVDV